MERIYDVLLQGPEREKVKIQVKVDGARVAATKAAFKKSGFASPRLIGLRRVILKNGKQEYKR